MELQTDLRYNQHKKRDEVIISNFISLFNNITIRQILLADTMCPIQKSSKYYSVTTPFFNIIFAYNALSPVITTAYAFLARS